MSTQPGTRLSDTRRPAEDLHYRELFWRTLGRLTLFYFVPLLFLAVFFHLQYRHLVSTSLRTRLEVIAEHQARTFDLFLRERLVNLENLIDDPRFERDDPGAFLPDFLQELQQTSDAFLDLGIVNGDGDLTVYLGPADYSSPVNYLEEGWYQDLAAAPRESVVTDIYLGFRDEPHFTIAVRRGKGPESRVLRAALSPEVLSRYLATLEGANEVQAAIVNPSGVLQVATPEMGHALEPSAFAPPEIPDRGFHSGNTPSGQTGYAYAWLHETDWALVVTDSQPGSGGPIARLSDGYVLVTLALFILVGLVILVRTRQVVGIRIATEEHEAELSGQLVQAAKLASVGELAAGIAHEINNPLAIIAEEVGVLRDALDPELDQEEDEPLNIPEHLQAIHDATFRCRDITRKLLTFVRRTEVRMGPQDLHEILDEVLEDMLENELSISNVTLETQYDRTIPKILTDKNQLIQVFVNLAKNAMDAMPGKGKLTVTTRRKNGRVVIAFRDTGCGMPAEHLEQVFMPFFTTKEPGKGTGLGLSVSYTIIRNFGGKFYVDSTPGRGSTFTVELPLAGPDA